MSITVCPTCGQPRLLRYGVRLSPKKAELLDLIEGAKGRGGIKLSQLAGAYHPGVPSQSAAQRLKVHICQLNDLLVSTDYRVVKQEGRYRISSA